MKKIINKYDIKYIWQSILLMTIMPLILFYVIENIIFTIAIFLFVFIAKKNIKPAENSISLIIGAGIFDTFANIVLLAALNKGFLSLVSVLASFYPAVTVLLARIFLKELMVKSQVFGLALALKLQKYLLPLM